VIQDIKQVLCFNSGEECHTGTFNRANVNYEVRYKDSMGDDEALKDLIKTIKYEHGKADKEGAPCSGIVYVHKRDDTAMIVAKLLKVRKRVQFQFWNIVLDPDLFISFAFFQAGVAAAPYHAGLKDGDRKRIQQEWTDGKVKVASKCI